MCIIIEAQYEIPVKKLGYLEFENPDGFGLMWRQDSSTHSYKTLSFDHFYEKYLEVIGSGTFPIVHMRLATHGDISTEMSHPFRVKDGYFMHNGVFSLPQQWFRKGESDTAVLARISEQYNSVKFFTKFWEMDSRSRYSRGILLLDSGEVKKFGSWATSVNGAQISNRSAYFV